MCFQVEFTKEEQSQIDAQEENERADEQEFIDWFGDLDNPVPSKCAVPPDQPTGPLRTYLPFPRHVHLTGTTDLCPRRRRPADVSGAAAAG